MTYRLRLVLAVATLLGVFTSHAQEKLQNNFTADLASNPIKTKIVAVNTFKQPLSVEIFSSREKDAQNRTVVNGLTVKGTIIQTSSSAVGQLPKGGGSGAAAASYAATGKMAPNTIQITISQRETGDEASAFADDNGNFTLTLKHDTLHTIYVNGVEYGQVKLKTKHDTAKNSINNVR